MERIKKVQEAMNRFSFIRNMQPLRVDPLFALLIACIIAIGLAMIFSASSVLGMTQYGDMYFFLKRSIVNLMLGLVALVVIAKTPYEFIRKYIWWINGITILLLLLSYVPAFQVNVNGADRWISIAGFQFQPSEIAKITVIVTLAHLMDDRIKRGTFNKLFNLRYGLPSIVGYMGVYVLLILMQKHLSATGLVLLVSMTMLFIGGMKPFYFGVMGAAVAGVGVIGILLEPFRMRRIISFTNPEADPKGAGFHIIQSWYALGSGEWVGLGLGMSRQKFSWLPENHTDFIVGIIGEELGFVGITVVILLFAILIWRGVILAMKAKEGFETLLVAGIVTLIFFQASINMLVVTGLFPVTGMPLPFISYGGTSTIILMMSLGFIFNVVSRKNAEKPSI